MARWLARAKKGRSLTSIVLGVDKLVQFDKQPPTLPPRSNVLRTKGSIQIRSFMSVRDRDWLQRPTHKLAGDTSDPNSLLHERAGQGLASRNKG